MLEDIRYGFRMMARNPGVTAVAALALALGIGANTAMFSVVNTVLLRPLPLKDPDRLLWLWPTNPSRGFPFAFTSYPVYEHWRKCQSLDSISAYAPGSANLTTGGDPERVALTRVNSTFLSMLGVRPFRGRDFLPEEDTPGGPRVAILDHKLWQRRFGADPKVINTQMKLDGEPYTIIGVLPAGFDFTGRENDLFVTIARSTTRTDNLSVGAFGRLKPGATPRRVEAEIDAVYRALEKDNPHSMKGWTVRAWRVRDFMVRDVRLSLLVLLGAVALVLLIACANVANLLLARAGSRQRELAMRTALGAGRGRLIRQLLTESMLLGVLGGAVGLVLAWWGVKLMPLVGPERYPFLKEISIDPRVLGFTVAATLVTGLLFGAAPALAASRARVYETLKEGGAGTGESLGRNRFRNALVVAEVALALLLMIGASLMMRSLLRLQETRPGFNPEGLLTASISLPMAKYPEPAQRVAFYDRLLRRIEAIPGVRSASMTNLLPLTGNNQGVGLVIEGAPPPRPGEIPTLYNRSVDRRYFQAMQIPLKRGRLFTEQDTGTPRVAIINETMAKRYWPDKDPVGKRFGNGRDWITVIGVAGDLKHMSLAQTPDPEFFEPYAQSPRPEMVLTVRTAADPMRLAPALRAAVHEVDGEQPVSRLGSMSERVSQSTAPRRFSVVLLAIFAVLALTLAAVGIYGVISFSVTRRTREIGIRMAMGAGTGDVLRMVVGQAVLLAVTGVALGVAGGLALTRVIGSLLYNVSATDPATFILVPLVLIGVAALASYIPARRAARVDPTVALRWE
jgi:putative ABC transport system permease protein